VRVFNVGKEGSVSQGANFFKDKFLAQCKDEEKSIVVHVTCCTDSKSMNVIIKSVLMSVMDKNLKSAGFVAE
jgi:hypothetical protein